MSCGGRVGESVTRVVASVKELLDSLSTDLVEDRVIRYIVNELREGRTFDSIMGDPYVLNNTNAVFYKRQVKELLDSLSTDLVEDRVIRYIVNELREGRTFDSIMGDPYVLNNTNESCRAQLLQNVSILKGIEDVIGDEFENYSRQTKA